MIQETLEYRLAKATKKIGSLCQEKRQKMKMPINKLSEYSKVSLGALSAFENGENIPSLGTILAVADTLHMENEVFAILYGILVPLKKQGARMRLKKALLEYGTPSEEIANVITFVQFIIDKNEGDSNSTI